MRREGCTVVEWQVLAMDREKYEGAQVC